MIFILRKISSLLSVFFKNDLSRIIIKDKKIINYIKKKLKKKKNINLKKLTFILMINFMILLIKVI